jgi:Zn-dependent peptidase ImmA (M78 family)
MVRRGFPAEADRLATAVRAELGLGVHDPLDPRRLAEKYGVPIWAITDLVAAGADATSVHRLTVVDPGCFSAGTVFAGTSRLIIFNPVHPEGRLANSLAHELAHLLLEHTPGPAIGPGGCRVWDPEMEGQADLLAAVLLVPRDAALACARVGLPHPIGAARFGVSADLMRWRTDHTGAARQAQAAARHRGRTIPRLGAADVRSVVGACTLSWLHDLTERQWLLVLNACGRALTQGSTPALIASLQPPSAS